MSIDLIQLNESNIELFRPKVEEFLLKVKYGRYLKEDKFDNGIFKAFETDNLIDYSLSKQVILATDNQKNIIGIIGFNYSDWDSKIFDKKVIIIKYFITLEYKLYESYNTAIALLEYFEKWMSQSLNEVVILKVDTLYSSCIRALKEKHYDFYETISIQTLNILSKDLNEYNDSNYRFAEEKDLSELKGIALENTFSRSHFYLDQRFEVDNVNKMYSNWINNAINSEDRVLIIEHESKIAGMFIYSVEELNKVRIATWKFAAVDKTFRNMSLGKKLFNCTIQACIKDRVEIIDTSLPIKNTISLRIHSKLQFSPVLSMYTFHKWFS